MRRGQLGVLIVLATIGTACAHVPSGPKPAPQQPLALDAATKIFNWQAPTRQERPVARATDQQAPFGRPFLRYETRTTAGNPGESMDSPLARLLQPVPVVDAPLPVTAPAPRWA